MFAFFSFLILSGLRMESNKALRPALEEGILAATEGGGGGGGPGAGGAGGGGGGGPEGAPTAAVLDEADGVLVRVADFFCFVVAAFRCAGGEVAGAFGTSEVVLFAVIEDVVVVVVAEAV